LDYEQDKAIFRKVLIVCVSSSNPAKAMDEDIRFRRFAKILAEAGFAPMQAKPCCITHLADLIDRFKPDIAFCAPDHLPATRESPAESGVTSAKGVNLHAWLETVGLPYVGSPPDVIELALSKTSLKEKWMKDGIATPAYFSLDSAASFPSIDKGKLPPFPCIVKPSDAGNSRGITKDSVVFDMKGLEALVAKLGKEFKHILIEHYLGLYPDFREITCACVGNGEKRLLMPAELVFFEPAKIHVITTEDKDRDKTNAILIRDESLKEGSKAFAQKAFLSAGVRDYSRCDLAFADGEFWAIEVNGQPMIPDPWFEACARHSGLSERQYILAIMRAAIDRASDRRAVDSRDAR
jgi:D-alanine-D-alanine ligase